MRRGVVLFLLAWSHYITCAMFQFFCAMHMKTEQSGSPSAPWPLGCMSKSVFSGLSPKHISSQTSRLIFAAQMLPLIVSRSPTYLGMAEGFADGLGRWRVWNFHIQSTFELSKLYCHSTKRLLVCRTVAEVFQMSVWLFFWFLGELIC